MRLRALVLLPLVLFATGCMKMEMSFDIRGDDSVDLVAELGISKQYSAELGAPEGKICEFLSSSIPKVPNIELKEGSDERYMSCSFSGKGSVSQFVGGKDASITHADGEYVFNFSADTAMPDDIPSGLTDISQVLTDFKVSVTFPGEVKEHSGSSTVSGTTVIWSDPNDLYSKSGLRAVAADSSSFVSGIAPWILWVGIVGVVIIAGAVGTVLWLRSRKKKAAANTPSPMPMAAYPYDPAQYPPGEYTSGAGQYPVGMPQPGVQQNPEEISQYLAGAPQNPLAAPQYPPPAPGQYPQAPGQAPQGMPTGSGQALQYPTAAPEQAPQGMPSAPDSSQTQNPYGSQSSVTPQNPWARPTPPLDPGA